jgi:hypothetical protein
MGIGGQVNCRAAGVKTVSAFLGHDKERGKTFSAPRKSFLMVTKIIYVSVV